MLPPDQPLHQTYNGQGLYVLTCSSTRRILLSGIGGFQQNAETAFQSRQLLYDGIRPYSEIILIRFDQGGISIAI